MINVALVHFHLRPGGVASVMLKQAAYLASQPNVKAVLVVGAAGNAAPVPVFVVPELDYDSFSGFEGEASADAPVLAKAIERALVLAFPDGCDLLHVHNPLLRKNARLLGALRLLQAQGYALLVQVHDLAEDFRPHVYNGWEPYPEACDYAAINSRDRDSLIAAGLEPEHVHFLPNPVSRGPLISREPVEAGAGRRLTALYPVRAIRRKNVGEALLLSRFLPEGAELAVTLPPTSTGDLLGYEAWKAFAGGWRVRFEAGLAATLDELYGQAFCAVTTSVKEGFGYSYLDPLVRGIPVVGREIPYVVGDFARSGIVFDRLYREILVPRGSLPDALREAAAARLAELRRTFGPVLEDLAEAVFSRLTRRFDGDVDFGALDEQSQRLVLDRVRLDAGFQAEVIRMNPFLESLFDTGSEQRTDVSDVVLNGYGEARYGKQLVRAYETAAARAARGRIDKRTFLGRYLDPLSFYLVAS